MHQFGWLDILVKLENCLGAGVPLQAHVVWEAAHVLEDTALVVVGDLVGVAAAETLSVDLFAFAHGHKLHQLEHSSLSPVACLSLHHLHELSGPRLEVGHDHLVVVAGTDDALLGSGAGELGGLGHLVVDFLHSAGLVAAVAVVRSAGLLVSLEGEALGRVWPLGTADSERAVTALLLGQLLKHFLAVGIFAGLLRLDLDDLPDVDTLHDVGESAVLVDFDGHLSKGIPEALGPLIVLGEGRAGGVGLNTRNKEAHPMSMWRVYLVRSPWSILALE